jgi:hypothetical protein
VTLVRLPNESAEDFKRRADVWQREVLEGIRLNPLEFQGWSGFFRNAVERRMRSIGIEREGDRLFFTSSDRVVDQRITIQSDGSD